MKTKVYGEGSRRQSFPVIFGTVVLLALGLLLLPGVSQAQVTSYWAQGVSGGWDQANLWDTGIEPPAQSVVFITNTIDAAAWTVQYSNAMLAASIGQLTIGAKTGTVSALSSTNLIVNINNTLRIDTAIPGPSSLSNQQAFTVRAGATVNINSGGWLDVLTTNNNSSSTALQIGTRSCPGGVVVVNGGTFTARSRSGAIQEIGPGGGLNNNSGTALIVSNGYVAIDNPRMGRYGPGGKVEIINGTVLFGYYNGAWANNDLAGTNWDTAGLIVRGGSMTVTQGLQLGGYGSSSMYMTGGTVTNTGSGNAYAMGWTAGISTTAAVKPIARYIQTAGTSIVTVGTMALGISSNNIAQATIGGGLLDVYGISLNPGANIGVQASLSITNNAQVYVGAGGMAASAALYTTNTVTLRDSAVLGATANWHDYQAQPVNITLVGTGTPTIKAADRSGAVMSIDLYGVLSGDGFIKSGGGTLTLWTNNTYVGTTRIDEGTLKLRGNGLIQSTTNIIIAAGAALNVSDMQGGAAVFSLQSGQTLMGNGKVVGSMITLSGSRVAPGTSVGSLRVTGDATLKGDLGVEVDGATVTADLLNLGTDGGTLDLSDPGSSVTFTWLSDPGNNAYVFATYGALVGTFGTSNNLPDGFSIDYDYMGIGSQIAVITTFGVIPEPSSLMLAGLGLVGAYLMRRRTRK